MASKRAGLHKVMRKHLMESLGQRDGHGWTCFYCRQSLLEYGDNNQPNSPAIDHRIPLARGGNDEMTNLRLACASCNQAKGTLTDDEFIQRIVSKPQPPKPAISELAMELRLDWQANVSYLYGELIRHLQPKVVAVEPISDETANERRNRLSKANW